ncbi:MAG: GNAT family N-acetyltransferase [Anaerolineales bacterium]|nr:GNAT family N-acetyltransferase [Anaerolineales bacterium]
MDISIRRLEPNDYEAIQKIFAGPKVVWGTLQLPYPSVEIWRNRIAEVPNDMFRLVAMVGIEMAGQLDLFTSPNHPRRRHTGQIGMAVRDDFQGQGVGSALMQAATDLADNWLNLRRLELEVYCDNEPAVKLYKKFGFEIEGTLKGYAFRAGEYVDVYSMARLKSN